MLRRLLPFLGLALLLALAVIFIHPSVSIPHEEIEDESSMSSTPFVFCCETEQTPCSSLPEEECAGTFFATETECLTQCQPAGIPFDETAAPEQEPEGTENPSMPILNPSAPDEENPFPPPSTETEEEQNDGIPTLHQSNGEEGENVLLPPSAEIGTEQTDGIPSLQNGEGENSFLPPTTEEGQSDGIPTSVESNEENQTGRTATNPADQGAALPIPPLQPSAATEGTSADQYPAVMGAAEEPSTETVQQNATGSHGSPFGNEAVSPSSMLDAEENPISENDLSQEITSILQQSDSATDETVSSIWCCNHGQCDSTPEGLCPQPFVSAIQCLKECTGFSDEPWVWCCSNACSEALPATECGNELLYANASDCTVSCPTITSLSSCPQNCILIGAHQECSMGKKILLSPSPSQSSLSRFFHFFAQLFSQETQQQFCCCPMDFN